MRVLFGLWPWNISSGFDFLLLFAAIGVLSVLGGRALASAVARRREEDDAPGIPIAPEKEGDGERPYRSPAERRRLTIGSIPRLQDAWPIAYLCGGSERLAEALASSAVAAGWVASSEGAPVAAPTDPLLVDLHERIGGKTTTFRQLRSVATTTAVRFGSNIERTLGAAGLLRNEGTGRRIGLAFAVPAIIALAIAFVRCVRAGTLHRPVGFLAIEMFLLLAITTVLAIGTIGAKSDRAMRYLAWLDAVTVSVRDEVIAGQRVGVDDVANAVALRGAGSIMRAPVFVEAVPTHAWLPVVALSSFSSSSGGTSCSSSGGTSCSSGGSSCSSGGSSCGSGGGCGG